MSYQMALWQDRALMPKTIYARVQWVLERYPEARDSYKQLMVTYWRAFDGLTGALLRDPEAFAQWFVACATAPKTLQNRAMKVQRRHPDLDARPEVRAQRNRQSRAGMVNEGGLVF